MQPWVLRRSTGAGRPAAAAARMLCRVLLPAAAYVHDALPYGGLLPQVGGRQERAKRGLSVQRMDWRVG